MGIDFYPRPPRGGRQYGCVEPIIWNEFLSTPSARRATTAEFPVHNANRISIHALREEGDENDTGPWAQTQISIHALREEGDSCCRSLRLWICISIHALREEGDPGFGWLCCCGFSISIHALREEGDPPSIPSTKILRNFYPRPPRGGRQQKQRQNLYFQTNYTTFCTNLEEP